MCVYRLILIIFFLKYNQIRSGNPALNFESVLLKPNDIDKPDVTNSNIAYVSSLINPKQTLDTQKNVDDREHTELKRAQSLFLDHELLVNEICCNFPESVLDDIFLNHMESDIPNSKDPSNHDAIERSEKDELSNDIQHQRKNSDRENNEKNCSQNNSDDYLLEVNRLNSNQNIALPITTKIFILKTSEASDHSLIEDRIIIIKKTKINLINF